MPMGLIHVGSIEKDAAGMFFQCTINNGGRLDIEAMAPTATALELWLLRLVHS